MNVETFQQHDLLKAHRGCVCPRPWRVSPPIPSALSDPQVWPDGDRWLLFPLTLRHLVLPPFPIFPSKTATSILRKKTSTTARAQLLQVARRRAIKTLSFDDELDFEAARQNARPATTATDPKVSALKRRELLSLSHCRN